MKKIVLSFLMVAGFAFCAGVSVHAEEIFEIPPSPPEEVPIVGSPIYRMYNPNSGEHLYTPSMFESRTLFTLGWKAEGTAWYAPNDYVGHAIYRVYNPNAGDHHYTFDVNEKAHLLDVGWEDDMLSFPSATDEGAPIYRLYNPNAIVGAHHFTGNVAERDMLVSVGWKDEGIGFYAESITLE